MLASNARSTSRPLPDILGYRHDRLLERYASEHAVAPEVASKRFRGLKEFLAVCAMMPGPKVTSWEIDTMWHTFLLYTKDYASFCGDYLGRFINHDPFERPNPGAYLATRSFAEQALGTLDADLWPLTGKGDCSSGCDD